jgi:5-methylcytosine-specific restriction protein A
VFLYTGEGQVGEMKFLRGNRAIRDHSMDGKELLLFESLGDRKPVRFRGTFSFVGWVYGNELDADQKYRRTIIFRLISTDRVDIHPDNEPVDDDLPPTDDLDELRRRAYKAIKPASKPDPKSTKSSYHERSKAVRDYVLARAAGICESCERPAPFRRKNGWPYLESHHTRRRSDGGPDDPRHVGGICPSCHREIHYGVDGDDMNLKLVRRVKSLESGKPI